MSPWVTTRVRHLARWPLILASHTTTLPVRSSSMIFSSSYSSQLTGKERTLSWPEWLKKYSTSPENVRTVHEACVQSCVFAPAAARPVMSVRGNSLVISEKISRRSGEANRHVESIFKKTPGLQSQDWEARGINFTDAVRIATQLHLKDYFSGRRAELISKNWLQTLSRTEAQAQEGFSKWAQADAESNEVLIHGNIAHTYTVSDEGHEKRNTSEMHPRERQILKLSMKLKNAGNTPIAPLFPKQVWPERFESAESVQADKVRWMLRQRKKAELASDAAEGIRSKRRPLYLAATSKGAPLAFKTMKRLQRVERRGREIVVDNEVKQRTKGAQQKKDEQIRENGTTSKSTASKEGRSTASLAKIKTLAKLTLEALKAIVQQKQDFLLRVASKQSAKKSAERQLRRAKQALAMKEKEARQKRWLSKGAHMASP